MSDRFTSDNPMVQHVYERVSMKTAPDDVVVRASTQGDGPVVLVSFDGDVSDTHTPTVLQLTDGTRVGEHDGGEVIETPCLLVELTKDVSTATYTDDVTLRAVDGEHEREYGNNSDRFAEYVSADSDGHVLESEHPMHGLGSSDGQRPAREVFMLR